MDDVRSVMPCQGENTFTSNHRTLMVKHNFQKGFVLVVTLIRIILIMLHLSAFIFSI